MLPITKMDVQTTKKIRFVLMDIDDTITTNGKLPALAYSALWQLHEAGLVVIPITGRPAGWCDLIVRQWPVDGIVGENGALVFWEESGRVKRIYHNQAVPNSHETLQRITTKVLSEIPESRIAGDQFARMFDVAFDFAEEEPRLPLSVVQHIKNICEEMGAIAKISSIHVNTWMGQYDKLSMTNQFLQERFGYNDPKEVLFFGDSPNDEPMFTHFPVTVGVANIVNYAKLMNYLPTYVTSQEGGEGFSEGVNVFLGLR
ncbi:MAG: HAD-IIB family hydrolase [Sphaerochaetaceae bacterium]